MDYDQALDIITGWVGSHVFLLYSFDARSIGFRDRALEGTLREGPPSRAPNEPVVLERYCVYGELQPRPNGRHFSLWTTDSSCRNNELLVVALFLARTTFSECAWRHTGSLGKELMIRHGRFRWVLRNQA